MTDGSRNICRPKELLLLGTVHSDPLGYKRTAAFLRAMRPDLIMVEISPYALAYRRQHACGQMRTLLKNLRSVCRNLNLDFKEAVRNPHISLIARQISVPFEFRASADYSRKYGVEVIAVDFSEFSRKWISTWEELISEGNIQQLLKLRSATVSASSQYDLAARHIRAKSMYDFHYGRDIELWRKREIHIAKEICSALERLRPQRPLYIGGWWHLTSAEQIRTVRDLLGIALSSCCLLDRGRLVQA